VNDGASRRQPPVAESEAALEVAISLLAVRDRTRDEVARRLELRGLDATASAAAVEALGQAGYLDDDGFAKRRADALAARGAGDALILDDLARRGVREAAAEAALAALEPESVRARRIMARRGRTRRTLRLLVSKGFTEETLEPLVADIEDGTVG